MDVDVAAGVEMPRSFGSARRAEVALRSFGTEVLRWNVAGGGFLSQGDFETWNVTDFFLVVELIPRLQLIDDLNDSSRASAVHIMVTNTWMNTHTELEFPTVPVFWFNTVLCDDNGKTIEQKLWVSEQMDCGRAGLVQDDTGARTKAGESLVDLMAPMTSTVAPMVASMVASMEPSMVASMASMASIASMVEALDWLMLMTAESKSDDERVDWAMTKGVESLVDSMALIASTVALMVASMASSRSKEEKTARDDREGNNERCQNGRRCHAWLNSGVDGGFDGGYDGGSGGFDGGFDGLDGFDGGAVGVVEAYGSRAQKR